MSVRMIMDGLFNDWLTAYRLTLQSDDDQEEYDDSRARELARSVTNSCGARIVRCLSDGEWHAFIRFLRIAHRIRDSDITDLFIQDLSDEEIDYAKIDLIAAGLNYLAVNLQVCECRHLQGVEQGPAFAYVLGFDAGFLHNEYRIRPDILRDIDLNELEQWTAPGEETPPQTHDQDDRSVDQRQPRGIRLRPRPTENDV